MDIRVNGVMHQFEVDPSTALVYVLRNHLDLVGTKLGCGLEQYPVVREELWRR